MRNQNVSGLMPIYNGRYAAPITTIIICLTVFLSANHGIVYGQDRSAEEVIAFPGAEGFGKLTTGGRGGRTLIVTTLNDSGPGSLREAIEQEGARTIVFEVAGTINLESPLKIKNGDLTVAGQSAPGAGICIRDFPVIIQSDNIVIRYMRFRLGDKKGQETDAISGRKSKNVIIDHCSMSWSVDECASFYVNSNFTMQWCMITESLNQSLHAKGNHGYGGIWGGQKATFHHNLIAHHNSRNPRFSGSKYDYDIPNDQLEFCNNVIYNWGSNSIYGNEEGSVDMINNYYKPGPATPKDARNRIVEPTKPYGEFFLSGNYIFGDPQVTEDNWDGGVHHDDPLQVKKDVASKSSGTSLQRAERAFDLVLHYAGASLHRDAVDERIVEEVESGKCTYSGSRTGTPGLIDSPEDVGGWPKLRSEPAPADRDRDGMPDAWEASKGLKADNPTDGTDQTLVNGYTNLEIYLNELVHDEIENQSQYYDFIVAADGSGDFKTVQAAIDAVPDLRSSETRIYIRNGTYKEKLVLPATKTNVTFIGEDVHKTILTNDDHARTLNTFGETVGTSGSSSFFVYGDGFTASNITFQNSAGPVGQAVAVRVDGDRVTFQNCRFIGFQDTLYPHGKDSRQYYLNCYIEGGTDFIFGWSTAVFEGCEIYSKDGGHYITAASTNEETKHGFVFKDCKLTGDAEPSTVYLGRPWRDYAQTVFIRCEMGPHIKSEGWHNWGKEHAEKTAFYAEYQSSGPGANPDARVNWSQQLTDDEAEAYTLENIFGNWKPRIN